METVILGLFAETSIHPGTGRGVGVVDLPVAREAATDYPVIVGSSLKGALRDKADRDAALAGDNAGADADENGGNAVTRRRFDARFGKQNQAGDLLVSDGRLLLLPARSLTGAYRWITCPHLIERYGRDLRRAGLPAVAVPSVNRGDALTNGAGHIFLEERQFSIVSGSNGAIEGLADAIGRLIPHPEARARLGAQLAVLNDDDFAWFARYGLSIQARNVLEEDTKQSVGLWYEETLPPDTLMYALIADRKGGAADALASLFSEEVNYLQTGGNETVGQGWFAVTSPKSPPKVQ